MQEIQRAKYDIDQFLKDDEEQKKWALKKGFYPGRIELYGLNEDNWEQYVPDYCFTKQEGNTYYFEMLGLVDGDGYYSGFAFEFTWNK